MRSQIERRIERMWYGESPFALLLVPFSWIFGLLVAARRRAFRLGWLRSFSLGVPVIIVGNVAVGGTGKTPVVVWLVDRLQRMGLQPGIVSRGYGGHSGNAPQLVTQSSAVHEVGDEPLLLSRLTGVPVCVGQDRVAAARHLLANQAVNVIVADDGLQHYRLRRDLEVIVIDGQRGFGNGYLLPAGPLREPRSRVAQADLVLSNGTCLAMPCPEFELVAGRPLSLNGQTETQLAAFKGIKVWALAGIGNPDRFYQMLTAHGIDYEPVAVADHGSVDLTGLMADRQQPILMTEKDAVKYPAVGVDNAWQIPVKVRLSPETETDIEAKLQQLMSGSEPV